MSKELTKYKSSEELIEELSSEIIKDLEESIEEKNKATLLVSGGNTPKPLFEKLSNIDFSWDKVTIALVDERWIENTNCQSNENLVREYLLKNFAAKAKFIGMYISNKEAVDCEVDCSNRYKEFFPFDVVVLGMGTDGHTASLFPENPKLKEAFDLNKETLCISIEPQTAPYTRMSLTLRAILSAKKLYLHMEGNEKLKVFQDAFKNTDIYKTPISAVVNSDKNIEVFYYE